MFLNRRLDTDRLLSLVPRSEEGEVGVERWKVEEEMVFSSWLLFLWSSGVFGSEVDKTPFRRETVGIPLKGRQENLSTGERRVEWSPSSVTFSVVKRFTGEIPTRSPSSSSSLL